MPIYQTRIYSGDVLEIEESFSTRKRGNKIPREKNKNLSSEQQQLLNFKNSQKNLCRLINTNFSSEDIYVTLTYATLLSLKDAKREFRNYIDRIKRKRKKQGLSELKYIVVTEHDGVRIHHHLIMSGMNLEDVIKAWNLGRVKLSPLDKDSDYVGLANYVTKGKRNEKCQRIWSSSRNLKRPTVKVKEIKRVRKHITEPKGYKIIKLEFNTFDVLGDKLYVRAIRIGGKDYSGIENKKEILRE